MNLRDLLRTYAGKPEMDLPIYVFDEKYGLEKVENEQVLIDRIVLLQDKQKFVPKEEGAQ